MVTDLIETLQKQAKHIFHVAAQHFQIDCML